MANAWFSGVVLLSFLLHTRAASYEEACQRFYTSSTTYHTQTPGGPSRVRDPEGSRQHLKRVETTRVVCTFKYLDCQRFLHTCHDIIA